MRHDWLARIMIAFLALIAAPLGIWQAITTMKSPLYEGINDENSEYVKNAAFVRGIEGFREGDVVLIEFFFRGSPTPRMLKKIEEHTHEYAQGTGGIVLSPTNCPRITEDEVGPYLPFYGVSHAEMPLWWREIKRDPLCGQLIESDGIVTSGYLLLIPPGGRYTRSFHRVLADILERVHPKGFLEHAWHEVRWLVWKNDIEPLAAEEGMEIYVTSFPEGEAVAERAINQDIALKFPIGLLCFAGLFIIISFRFLHQHYGPVLLTILLTLEWTFGAIGALALFGFYHTVYSVIPLGGGASVMGLSFMVQKMEAFEAAKEGCAENRWMKAGKITHLSMAIIVLFTTLAFILFLGNFTGLQRMKEIGMFFVCAALIAWLNARVMLPVIHHWWTELFGEREEKDLWQWQRAIAKKLDSALASLVKWIWDINKALCHPWKRRCLQVAPPLAFAIAILLFSNGNIITVSAIESFLQDGSKTEEAFFRAQRRGVGYSPFQIMVSASSPNALTNDRFIEAAQKLLENVEKIEGMGMVLSSLQGILHQRAQRSLSDAVRVVEEGERMVHAIFGSYLHTRRHIMILAFHPMTDSAAIRKAINAIEAYGGKIEAAYHDLDINVRVWGDPAIFTEMAERVPKQTPWNVFTSLLFVFGAYTIVVASLNWWYKTRGISPLWGGWTLSQSFMFATGVTGCVMAICGIPLNIATVPISEVAIAAAADFNVYLAVAFLLFLYRGLSPRMAMKNAFEEKAEAVMKDYIGNSLCFVLLISSSLQQVAELGWLMPVNLFVCVAWGLFMTLPMLAANAEKRKETIDEDDTSDFDYVRAASLG